MRKVIIIKFFVLCLLSCKTAIKNSNAKVEIEEGVAIIEDKDEAITSPKVKKEKEKELASKENCIAVADKNILGFWVGYFRKATGDDYDEKTIYVDEGFHWSRENKINIAIDEVKDSLVIGHSVVAGNDRPFKGFLEKTKNGDCVFRVKEPGTHKYDGEFLFTIKDDKLIGNWLAYNDIDIRERKYTLEKKKFVYNPAVNLEESKRYIDWNKSKETKTIETYGDDEVEEWINAEFASATDFIYTVNASSKLLTKKEVENLKKGDLVIIRNTIYARHGYSFKNRPLRVFFDAQTWYVPVYTNIKNEFTELEKKNIQLLLKYEKNALEYYDYFGRG